MGWFWCCFLIRKPSYMAFRVALPAVRGSFYCMKTIRIRFMALALAGGALVGTSYADKVSFDQLPLGVKDKIRAHTGAAAVEDIDRQTQGGKTTYEVAYKKDGQ